MGAATWRRARFQTGLTYGTVNTSARRVVANSKIPAASYDGDNAMTHLYVLWIHPHRNTMVRSVVPITTTGTVHIGHSTKPHRCKPCPQRHRTTLSGSYAVIDSVA